MMFKLTTAFFLLAANASAFVPVSNTRSINTLKLPQVLGTKPAPALTKDNHWVPSNLYSAVAPSVDEASVPVETVAPAVEVVKADEDEDARQQARSIRFMQGLALNSGLLNGVFLSGILGKVQAVGPVTDSWTKNALALAHGDVSKAVFIATVLLSFSLGAFAHGLMNPKPGLFKLEERKKPVLLAGSLMALSTALVAKASMTAAATVPALAFFLVCAANGIQNSYSSFATANMCRTSHFTGTTTDLFTIIAQCLRGNTEKKYRIPIYSGLTVMFWLGGFIGTRWTQSFADAAICLGASSCFYLASAIPSKVPKKIISVFRPNKN